MTSTDLLSPWNDSEAKNLDEQGLLLYRARLLSNAAPGSELASAISSAKRMMPDPLSQQNVPVLQVKCQSRRAAPPSLDDFATLYLEKLEHLKAGPSGLDHQTALRHCIVGSSGPMPPHATLLHALIPHAHVDFTFFNPVMAIAMADKSESLVKALWGEEVGFLPYAEIGIDLAINAGKLATDRPGLKGILLEGLGLLSWGAMSKDCHENTARLVHEAAAWLSAKSSATIPVLNPFSAERRRAMACRLMPEIRGLLASSELKIGHFNDSPDILDFVNSAQLLNHVSLWPIAPRPLVMTHDLPRDQIAAALANHHDQGPAIILVPQLGLFTFEGSKAAARELSDSCASMIAIIKAASSISSFQPPSPQSFASGSNATSDHLPLSGRIALVTGGASGIGAAIASRLLAAGACVTIADIDEAALGKTHQSFAAQHGGDNILSVKMDVTSEAEVVAGFEATAAYFGGLDIVVNNAGIAIRSPVEETSLEIWDRQLAILGTGYFLVGREGYRLLKRQGCGGSMIFISSKNGMIASEGASAYGTMKAAELHLARSMALEGAPLGIRVNSVTPDAVLRGSKLMAGNFAQKRAEALNIKLEDLEDHYRKRSLLQRSVYAEDVAEAVYFFASDLSLKSTGNILNVDAGHAASFSR